MGKRLYVTRVRYSFKYLTLILLSKLLLSLSKMVEFRPLSCIILRLFAEQSENRLPESLSCEARSSDIPSCSSTNSSFIRPEVSNTYAPYRNTRAWVGSCVIQVGLAVANILPILLTLFLSPGVHWVQDPRSRVYNFPPRLQSIPKVEEFAFDRVTGFIKSSSDNVCFCEETLLHIHPN